MKKTFTIKLDTDITIDFNWINLNDAQQRGGKEAKELIVNEFLDQCGIDEFEVIEKHNSHSLFEAISAVVKAEIDYMIAHKKDFELLDVSS